MIYYSVQGGLPHHHFIRFKAIFPATGEVTKVQLAVWRPGRYELGQFAKNVRAWRASHPETGEALSWKKDSPHTWSVDTKGCMSFVVTYEYYAFEMNAGSSFWDGDQLYINPVNAFCFLLDKQEEEMELSIQVPRDFTYAGGIIPSSIKEEGDGVNVVLQAKNFDHLADSPFVLSNHISCTTYYSGDLPVHVWMNGEADFGSHEWLKDFQAFTDLQIRLFGGFPRTYYHFIFQFAPYFIRHGVEHENSTVIAMGPAQDFHKRMAYHSFLGISSHELFHAWNVKRIRPADMTPYDYTCPNYSETGMVTEGVTTYYGDMMLVRSGVWNTEKCYFQMAEFMELHAKNQGRFAQSVVDSSIDTWVDGYTPGIPGRKVSIYNEGGLLAWMMDVDLLYNSEGKVSMDDVMRKLYAEFGERGVGYTLDDYWRIVAEFGLTRCEQFRFLLAEGPSDYLPHVSITLQQLGLDVEWLPSGIRQEDEFGLLCDDQGKITEVIPGSPADLAGVGMDDSIVEIEHLAVQGNAKSLFQQSSGPAHLVIQNRWRKREVTLLRSPVVFARKCLIKECPTATEKQKSIRAQWMSARCE